MGGSLFLFEAEGLSLLVYVSPAFRFTPPSATEALAKVISAFKKHLIFFGSSSVNEGGLSPGYHVNRG
jgi:hypothetical protein